MTTIAIREIAGFGQRPNAVVSFDRRGEFPVSVAEPFSEKEKALLEWYFEKHLKFPFTRQVDAAKAAASVKAYGLALFRQMFEANLDVFGQYSRAGIGGAGDLAFEVCGSPEFHGLHWETLWDPRLPRPFVLDAPMVRCIPAPRLLVTDAKESHSIKLLVVSARPMGKFDVGYRTITRPLVKLLRNANLPVKIDILRPGAFDALIDHLESVRDRHGAGYYHVIHFDLHGALMTYDQVQNFESVSPFSYKIQMKDRYGGRDDIKVFLATVMRNVPYH